MIEEEIVNSQILITREETHTPFNLITLFRPQWKGAWKVAVKSRLINLLDRAIFTACSLGNGGIYGSVRRCRQLVSTYTSPPSTPPRVVLEIEEVPLPRRVPLSERLKNCRSNGLTLICTNGRDYVNEPVPTTVQKTPEEEAAEASIDMIEDIRSNMLFSCLILYLRPTNTRLVRETCETISRAFDLQSSGITEDELNEEIARYITENIQTRRRQLSETTLGLALDYDSDYFAVGLEISLKPEVWTYQKLVTVRNKLVSFLNTLGIGWPGDEFSLRGTRG